MRDEPLQTTDCADRSGPTQADFFGQMIVSLAATIEDVIGLEDASGFVSRVGNEMGRALGRGYADADGALPEDPARLGAVLADLKGRIDGDFEVSHVSAERVELVGCRCPFGDKVVGHPSLCMMTTNVFGRIAADARGYASVRIEEAIALGHPRCRVTLTLQPEARLDGHEFFA